MRDTFEPGSVRFEMRLNPSGLSSPGSPIRLIIQAGPSAESALIEQLGWGQSRAPQSAGETLSAVWMSAVESWLAAGNFGNPGGWDADLLRAPGERLARELSARHGSQEAHPALAREAFEQSALKTARQAKASLAALGSEAKISWDGSPWEEPAGSSIWKPLKAPEGAIVGLSGASKEGLPWWALAKISARRIARAGRSPLGQAMPIWSWMPALGAMPELASLGAGVGGKEWRINALGLNGSQVFPWSVWSARQGVSLIQASQALREAFGADIEEMMAFQADRWMMSFQAEPIQEWTAALWQRAQAQREAKALEAVSKQDLAPRKARGAL